MARRGSSATRRAWASAQLVVPPLPDAGRYLMTTYLRLRKRKGVGMVVQPIEWPDIAAFSALPGQGLSPFEIGVVEAIDDAFMAARSGRIEIPDSVED